MFENKTEATSNVKKLLLSKLTSWKGKDVKNEDESYYYFHSNTSYLLKMLWQSRLGKINEDDIAMCVWLSENYLAKEYEFDATKIKEPQLSNVPQNELVNNLLKEVWKDYLKSDLTDVIKPPKQKVGLLKKIFGK